MKNLKNDQLWNLFKGLNRNINRVITDLSAFIKKQSFKTKLFMNLLRFYLKILHEHHKIFWGVSYINLIIDDFSHHLYGKTVFPQAYSDLKAINLRENVEW